MEGKVRYGVQLSDNMVLNTNGYLECYNCPIARTGEQVYLGHELSDQLDPNKQYTVKRMPEDVFNESFMASLENVDLTLYHPEEDVTIDNVKDLSKGYMRDIRIGKDPQLTSDSEYVNKDGKDTLYGDIVVKDTELIQMIQDGTMRELSVGYDAEYHALDENTFKQVPINGNHIALVPQGRAGTAKVRDGGKSIMSKVLDAIRKRVKKTRDESKPGASKKQMALVVQILGEQTPEWLSQEEAGKIISEHTGGTSEGVAEVHSEGGETKSDPVDTPEETSGLANALANKVEPGGEVEVSNEDGTFTVFFDEEGKVDAVYHHEADGEFDEEEIAELNAELTDGSEEYESTTQDSIVTIKTVDGEVLEFKGATPEEAFNLYRSIKK